MKILDDLSRAIYGLNYEVYLTEIQFSCSQDLDVESKVRLALGSQDVVIGGTWRESKNNVISGISEKLLYEGGIGSHPSRKKRPQAEALTLQYVEHLRMSINEDSLVIGFWFKEGHPAYPVFWEYAYLIEDGQQNVLLIGSSSD